MVQKKATTAKVALQATPGDILEEMAATFRERNAEYKDNFKMVGPIMKVLFPEGVPVEIVGSHQFHLLELIVVKLSRFAISGLVHEDSIHDAGVYAAMIESIVINSKQE